jgi:small subunit ribosomal protein S20
MPVTKTAKRAFRSSRRKEAVNKKVIQAVDIAVRVTKKKPSKESLQKAYSALDKGVKKKILHKNKAANIKSALARFVSKNSPKKK